MSLRAIALFAALFFATGARAQCPDWIEEFTPGHADGGIFTSAAFDDGSGPALYLGGSFTRIGSTSALHVARWNGTTVAPVGTGLGGTVVTLAVLDVGGGPALYAGGVLTIVASGATTSVARWDGNQWIALGAQIPGPYGGGASVTSLAVFDFGTGPALYVGGSFAGGFLGNGECVRRWNGSSFVSLGSEGPGAHPFFMTPFVAALAVFDDGSGSKLYAGGQFLVVSGVAGSGVARWNGSAWETVTLGTGQTESGSDGDVAALAVHDFGGGPALYAGGSFTLGGVPEHVARFSGGAWAAVPNAPNGRVACLTPIAASGGVAGGLYLGGSFTSAGGASAKGIARYDGSSFLAVDAGNPFVAPRTVASFDDGSLARLCAACEYPQQHLGAFGFLENGAWHLIEPGNAPLGSVHALHSFDDDGDGRASLFVGGLFDLVAETATRGIARYDRGVWSSPAPQLLTGRAFGFATLAEGGQATLYAAGLFRLPGALTYTGVMRFENGTWTQVGPYWADVHALARFDGGLGDALWAGSHSGVRRWDGASWTVPFVVPGSVEQLMAFDDGSGEALYLRGSFAQVAGTPAIQFGRWKNGVDALVGTGAWQRTGATAMVLHDDGSGPHVFVAGTFSNSQAPAQFAIARLDGTAWTPIATSLTLAPLAASVVSTLGVHTGPSGTVLVAGGGFASIDGVAAAGIAAWDGVSWSAFGAGLSSTAGLLACTELSDHDFGDGAGPDLIAAGGFTQAGGGRAAGIARYRACGDAAAFCFGDGSGTACPCGNAGAVGHGCGNVNFASGALLSVSGRAQVASDSLTLVCTGISNGTPALFYQGTAQVNGGAGVVFGDGFACITGALIRLGVRFTANGEANFGAAAGPGAISLLGFVPGAGGTRHYGCRYRSDVGFCSHAGFNYSNAVSVVWAP